MTSRQKAIGSRFALCRAGGRSALVPFFPAGYPSARSSLYVLEALAESGADVIELGVPFSDPLADGPTIQRASFDALREGMTPSGALDVLRRFRERWDLPVVLFTYLNPIVRFGVDEFLVEAVGAGADGILVTDLPAGADPGIEERLVGSPLDLIRLLAPTTRPERIPEVARGGGGFLYYISRTGVTGAGASLRADLAREVEAVRAAVELPVAVGFGIATPEHARTVASVADGVVVGSALIDAFDRGGVEELARLARGLREAMETGERR